MAITIVMYDAVQENKNTLGDTDVQCVVMYGPIGGSLVVIVIVLKAIKNDFSLLALHYLSPLINGALGLVFSLPASLSLLYFGKD